MGAAGVEAAGEGTTRFPSRALRVGPLPAALEDEQSARLIEATLTADGRRLNIFTTLVRNQALFKSWLPFTGRLLRGSLPAQDRELVILRVAVLCESEYEYVQHTQVAREAGLPEAHIVRVQVGPEAPGWTGREAALLRLADELHCTSAVSDPTWSALADIYTEPELIELVMLVGQYHLVAYALNALGVQLEDAARPAPSCRP